MNQNLNAKAFLSEIKKLNFTGKDFLEIIGNSKISNNIYHEIKENPKLTHSMLVDLLEGSSLKSEDYARILGDAQAMVMRRAQERRRSKEDRLGAALSKAEKRLEAQEKVEYSERAAQLIAEAQKKAKEQLLAEARASDIKLETPLMMPLKREASSESKIPDITEEYKGSGETGPVEIEADFFNKPKDIDDPEQNDFTDEEKEILKATPKTNKAKLILCFCLVVILIGMSTGLRYYYTGSFFPEISEKVGFKAPETYEELAARLQNTENLESVFLPASGNYYIGDKQNERKTLLHNDKYIFNIIDGKLYVVEVNDGTMEKTHEVFYNDMAIREMYLLNDKLYIVLESEYLGNYHHEEQADPEDEEAEPEIISGSFTNKTTKVLVFNAGNFSRFPELEFSVDGEYNEIIIQNNKFIVITDYTPHEPLAYSDLNAYIPAYAVFDDVKHIDIANIYAPPAKLMNTAMTVISVIDGENVNVRAVVGGAGNVYCGNNAFYVTQNTENTSRLIKLGTSDGAGHDFRDISGIIPDGAVNEANGILRVAVYQGGRNALYVYDSDFTSASMIINIGEEPPAKILFDERRVYFITAEKASLYVFDTTVPEEVLPVSEPNVHISSDSFYRLSDRERIEVVVEVGTDEKRAGIRLNVYRDNNIVATHLITAESNVTGNWNPFIYSDFEDDREAVFISPGGTIVMPLKYFNGVINVEKIIVFDYSEHMGIVQRNEIVFYENREPRRAVIINGFIYSFWGKTMVSADEIDGMVHSTIEL